MNHRNWISPITLTRNKPVTQAILNGLTSATLVGKILGNSLLGLRMLTTLHSRKGTRLHKITLSFHCLIPRDMAHFKLFFTAKLIVESVIFRTNDGRDLKIIFLSKIKIALVAAWNTHNSTSSIIT